MQVRDYDSLREQVVQTNLNVDYLTEYFDKINFINTFLLVLKLNVIKIMQQFVGPKESLLIFMFLKCIIYKTQLCMPILNENIRFIVSTFLCNYKKNLDLWYSIVYSYLFFLVK